MPPGSLLSWSCRQNPWTPANFPAPGFANFAGSCLSATNVSATPIERARTGFGILRQFVLRATTAAEPPARTSGTESVSVVTRSVNGHDSSLQDESREESDRDAGHPAPTGGRSPAPGRYPQSAQHTCGIVHRIVPQRVRLKPTANGSVVFHTGLGPSPFES